MGRRAGRRRGQWHRGGGHHAAPFGLGQVVLTPGALSALQEAKTFPTHLLDRHQAGDWGDVPADDAEENHFSLDHGFRIISSYTLETGERIWIITEHDRSITTLLTPSEY